MSNDMQISGSSTGGVSGLNSASSSETTKLKDIDVKTKLVAQKVLLIPKATDALVDSQPEITVGKVVEKVQELISKVKGAGFIQMFEHVKDQDQVIKVLEDVQKYILKAKVFEDRIELKVGEGKDPFHIYVSLDNHESIQIVFGEAVAHQVEAGQFKKTGRAYGVQGGRVSPIMFTKQSIARSNVISTLYLKDSSDLPTDLKLTEEEWNKQAADRRSCEREQRTLETCKRLGLPGTPETHLVSYYVGKGGVVKQKIMQAFYPGGNLQEAIERGNLTTNRKKKIFSGLCHVLAAFHDAEMSHNDYRSPNIVLDEKMNPVMIDFGGVTFQDGGEGQGAMSATHMPPEMVDRDLLKQWSEQFDLVTVLEDELNLIEGEYVSISEMDLIFEKIEFLKEQIKETNDDDELKSLNEKVSLLDEKKEKIKQINEQVARKYDSKKSEFNKEFEKLEEFETKASESIEPENWQPYKCDVYALGLVAQELFGDDIPDEYKPVIDGLLEVDPEKRLSAEMALAMLTPVP